eukprot:562436-Prorocentrum_minimum.AAC.2
MVPLIKIDPDAPDIELPSKLVQLIPRRWFGFRPKLESSLVKDPNPTVPNYVNDIKLVDTSTIASESALSALGITVTGSGSPHDIAPPWGVLADDK